MTIYTIIPVGGLVDELVDEGDPRLSRPKFTSSRTSDQPVTNPFFQLWRKIWHENKLDPTLGKQPYAVFSIGILHIISVYHARSCYVIYTFITM